MRRFQIVLPAAAALLAMSAGVGNADCREDLAQLQQGVAKDGTQAPLAESTGGTQQSSDGQPAHEVGGAMAPTGGAAKDGTQMPLASDPGVATSADDAQAQQQGGGTAAEVAGGTADASTAGALEEAKAALARGDEAACLNALERVKS